MVFPSDIIETLVIHMKLKARISFINKTGAFIRELLAWINPLFNNSFKVFHNTNNLSRVILYKRPTAGFCNGPWLGLYYSRLLAGTYPIGLMV